MRIIRVSAVYFSPTGTTRRTVHAIAEGTGMPFSPEDLTLPERRRNFSRSFAADELVIVGLPVYAGRLPRNLEDFFEGLHGNSTPAVAVVVYGNRDYNDALLELKMKLDELGFVAKAAAAFIGEHSFSAKIATGRPDAGDIAIARSFGHKALQSVINDIPANIEVKGNYPFTWKGFDPNVHVEFPPHPRLVTDSSCTQCKECSDSCPWGAIDWQDCKTRDYSRCMICYRCVKNCPSGAIRVAGDKFLAYLPQFEAKLNARHEPEVFLPV